MDDLFPLRCGSSDDPSLHEPLIALTSPARDDAGWSLFGGPPSDKCTKDAPVESAPDGSVEGSFDGKERSPDIGMPSHGRTALATELREPVSILPLEQLECVP